MVLKKFDLEGVCVWGGGRGGGVGCGGCCVG